MRVKIIFLVIITIGLFSCKENYIPKKRAFFRLETPKKEYRTISNQEYKFDILKSSRFIIKKDNKTWTSVLYPSLKASLYLTYFSNPDIEKLSEDARKSAYKHTIRADDIVNLQFAFPDKKLYGTIYSIEGNAATPVVFYFTDSISQFLHGTVYFNCAPNSDSLKPITHFIREDIQHIIESFEWINHTKE